MAKETKADREARMALEQEAEYQQFVREYPARFAKLMFDYMNLSHAEFYVKQLDAETYEFSRDSYSSWKNSTLKVSAPANYNRKVMYDLEEAERYLQDYARELAESLRKYQVKQAALNKLSAEERELLGL